MGDRTTPPVYKPPDINWAQVWRRQMDAASFRGEGIEFWNRWAKAIPKKSGASAYVKEVLDRMRLEPGCSVLDVGAGMGTLSIPLARQGHPVTALDHSPIMLEMLAREAEKEGLPDIRLLNLDWTQSRPGVDFDLHDVVLVSRSLPSSGDITHNIRLIDQAARRTCFISWKATVHSELKTGISALLGIEYIDLPDYIVLYNLLHSMGILADVQIFKIDAWQKYQSLEEAFTQIIRNRNIEDHRMKKKVLDFMAEKLPFQDGYYCRHEKTTWALISWSK